MLGKCFTLCWRFDGSEFSVTKSTPCSCTRLWEHTRALKITSVSVEVDQLRQHINAASFVSTCQYYQVIFIALFRVSMSKVQILQSTRWCCGNNVGHNVPSLRLAVSILQVNIIHSALLFIPDVIWFCDNVICLPLCRIVWSPYLSL